MKTSYFTFLCILFAFPVISQQTWSVDNPHSNVRFEVGWQDFSMRTGEFKVFSGNIETDTPKDLSNAKIKFVVDATSVDMIADRLAMKVKSDAFLNVEVYPEIVFVSNGMKKMSENTYITIGKLTICGVEQEQEVAVTFKGEKETKKGDIFGIEVQLEVDRTRFGLDWGKPRLADNIILVGHLLYKEEEKE